VSGPQNGLPALPQGVLELIARLERAGHPAYAVGGCVRDGLLGRPARDWDIGTAATPAQVSDLFDGDRVLPTGLPHGTVTLLLEGGPYEVTTFRMDGGYSDGRHPDRVTFVPELLPDLARRDFTVNAMALHPERGLIDPFGGRADLAAGLIRCVGEPRDRFAEDALRILRALRLAAELGFAVEDHTAKAALAQAESLCRVSPERLRE